jgi:anhydro-N-acetylmuramic acid kinase
MLAVGLMSGTSLDGIDAALVSLHPRGEGYSYELLRFATAPFARPLVERLLAALPPHAPPPAEVAALDALLGEAFGAAARAIAGDAPLDFVASHGLTLFHDGAARRTLQIGDPYRIRDRARATVVCDFRRADCAAGGEGAPLVPFADALLFADAARDTVALNLGGIANLTLVPRGAAPAAVRAWDTGPGNILLDAFVRERSGGAQAFDRDGELAARGRADPALLDELLADPYYRREPPKSTGRERFNAAYLRAHAATLDLLSLEDGAATLAALTARSVAAAIAAHAPPGARVVVSGGGARNPALLALLRAALGEGRELVTSAALGVDPDAKEALAFALLGYETLRGRSAGLPRVTGAAASALLGAIVPYELDPLLAKIEAELAANVAG